MRICAPEWAIDGTLQEDLTEATLVPEVRYGSLRHGRSPHLAVRIPEMIIHDNRRLFGEAAIRVDALVIHGGGKRNLSSFYSPGTFRFERVADGDHLPIGADGLLIFYGRPRYFLDLFLIVSRDRKESSSLHAILTQLATSEDAVAAQAQLLTMITGVPDTAALNGALRTALLVGDAALQGLRKATGTTIGLYRNSWLCNRDSWGLGMHPPSGLFRTKDISFRFEIIQEFE